MIQYYTDGVDFYWRSETASRMPVGVPLTEITRDEYELGRAAKNKADQAHADAFLATIIAAEESIAQRSYAALRTAGLSEDLARALSKYYD